MRSISATAIASSVHGQPTCASATRAPGWSRITSKFAGRQKRPERPSMKMPL
jgi:hypothetical protein